jgi:hypothetical protein
LPDFEAAEHEDYAGRDAAVIAGVIPGDAARRTQARNCAPENLEIPNAQIAHLRFALTRAAE